MGSEDPVVRNERRVRELSALERRGRQDQTELDLRSAILRLLNGTPTKSDGSWTVVNLVAESGVPRPTAYRYESAIADFNAIANTIGKESGGTRDQLQALRAELKAEKKARSVERRAFLATQSVLVQRLHAVTLALAQARGDEKVVSLLSPRAGKADVEA